MRRKRKVEQDMRVVTLYQRLIGMGESNDHPRKKNNPIKGI
jgi:hypothetical protein